MAVAAAAATTMAAAMTEATAMAASMAARACNKIMTTMQQCR